MMLAQITVANWSHLPVPLLIRYGAQIKRHSCRSLLPRSVRKVFSSPAQCRISLDQTDYGVPRDADNRLDLLDRQNGEMTPMYRDGESLPFWRGHSHRQRSAMPVTGNAGCRETGIDSSMDASVMHAPHLQRHDGGGILSKTENLVFHTRTTPGKGMNLPVRVAPRLPVAADLRPAPDEAVPPAPTPLYVDQKQRRRTARAARQQVGMLVPEIKQGVDHGRGKLALMDVLNGAESLREYASDLFFCRPGNAALGQLVEGVQQALQSYHANLPQSCHLILLWHLAQACAGDAERAVAALHALQSYDFMAFGFDLSSFIPGQQQVRHIQARARLDALSIAGKLSASAVNFKLLLQLIGPAWREPQQRSLQRLLQAVAQIEMEQGRQVDLAHHVVRAALDVESGKASLAQIVLHSESLILQQAVDMYADLSEEQISALFAWNHGFREDGEGSELALVRAGLLKMLKYIRRANHMQELLNVEMDKKLSWQSLLKYLDARARIICIGMNQAIGRKKSPLSTQAILGINNARQMQPPAELQVLYENTINAIALLHDRLQEAPGRLSVAALRQQLQDPLMPLPALVEHSALLAHWMTLIDTQTPLGHQLDAASIRTIADKIAQDYACPAYLPVLENKLTHWIGRELRISDLQQWAETHHALLRQPLVCMEQTRNVEDALSYALRRATESISGRSFAVDQSQEEMHQFMRSYLCEHNVGNTFAISNGSAVGLNTLPVIFAIRKLNQGLSSILPVALTPAIDARLSKVRNAVLNVGSTAHGFEIFIGTQKQKLVSLGGAVNISTSPFLKYAGITAGAGVSSAFGFDDVGTSGVMVRSTRRANADGSALDTAAARAGIVDFLDLMFTIAGEKGDAPQAGAVWNRLAGRFFDNEAFSIGWQEQQELTPHLTGTFGLYERMGLGVDHGSLASAGVSVSRTADRMPSGTFRRAEKTGAVRQLRSSHFTRHQQTVSIAVVGASTSVPVHSSDSNTESLSFPQISETLNFLARDKGASVIFRTLIEQGELSPLFSLRETELRDVDHFCQFLQQPECYSQYLRIFNARYGIDNGERKLQEFIEQSKNWKGPNLRYLMRSRLREEVRVTLNELIALAESNHLCGVDRAMQKEIAETMEQLLQAESSWVATEVMVLESQTARDGKGLNFGLQFAAQHAVASNRELSYVAVPLQVADQWVRARG